MTKNNNDLVSDFILSTVPEQLLVSYRLLAQFKYPLSDKYSLKNELDMITKNAKASQLEKSATNLIASKLQATDFPINTAINALEKFHERLFPQHQLPDSFPDFVERPSISGIYQETFGNYCGQRATEAYNQAIMGGLSEYQAIMRGHVEGRRCERSYAEMLREFMLRQHFRFLTY